MHNTFINIFNYLFTLLALESPIMRQFPLNLVVLKKEKTLPVLYGFKKHKQIQKDFTCADTTDPFRKFLLYFWSVLG